jgi:hypothetical protein
LHADPDFDASYLKQKGFEGRLQAYRDGEFAFIGVRAVAEIKTPCGKGWVTTQLESPGCWGIEDDSGEDFLNEVYAEEKATLLDMLESFCSREIVEN